MKPQDTDNNDNCSDNSNIRSGNSGSIVIAMVD